MKRDKKYNVFGITKSLDRALVAEEKLFQD